MTFKMRSGNGPLAFKEMGAATPAKGIMDMFKGKSKQDKNIEKFKKETVIVDGKTYKKGEEPKKEESKLSSEGTQESLVKDLPKGHEARVGVDAEKGLDKKDNIEAPKKKGFLTKIGDFLGREDVQKGFNTIASVAHNDPSMKQYYMNKAKEGSGKKATEEELLDLEFKRNRVKGQNQTMAINEEKLNKDNTLPPNNKGNGEQENPTEENVKIITQADKLDNEKNA